MAAPPQRSESAGAPRFAALALVLVVLAGGAARAEDAEEAKLHFQRAQATYKLGKYKEAIQHYEAAYRALNEPAFLFNLAQAHRRLGEVQNSSQHLQQALTLYKNYLRDAPAAQNRETVVSIINDLKKMLTELEAKLRDVQRPGRLVLRDDGSATDAIVLLGDKPLGRVPLSVEVPPGSHLLIVRKAGHRPWSSAVTVSAGTQLEVPVSLRPLDEGGRGPRAGHVPLYRRWWFWTIAGAVLVGAGTGIGVYLGTRGDSIPSMPQIDLRR